MDYVLLSKYDTTIELSYIKLYTSGITNHIFDNPQMGAPLVADQNYWPWRNIGIGFYYFIISIFEKDIKFNIKLYSYRNEPAIDVSVIENDLEVDPQKSCGGGLNDIISFVVKIIFIYLKKSSKIIILDEPLKFLSRDYIEQSSNFIHEISKRMDIQIILVSHKTDLEISCDKLITIEKNENRSIIK